jgi:hypothetical protein
MKSLLLTVVFASLTGAALATPISSRGNLRVADAAADACFASCASQAESCKRTCQAGLPKIGIRHPDLYVVIVLTGIRRLLFEFLCMARSKSRHDSDI